MSQVKLLWSRSVSDTVGQQLTTKVNDVEAKVLLNPDVESFNLEVTPGDVVHAELFAYNRFYRSATVALDFTVPTAPEAPTNFRFEVPELAV